MAERIDLLIIDPQVDFCDPKGSLYVDGSEGDMQRVASMIDRFGDKISKIHVTLDCHYRISVAHPLMWRDSDGNPPPPFTLITSKDIKEGIWFPIFPDLRQRFIDYCEELENSKKYNHIIWPEHCLIGTRGNNILPVLCESLKKWEEKRKNNVNYVSKGSNIYVEHFGCLKAQVVDSSDSSTQLNIRFLENLKSTNKLLISGEALSHCVKESVQGIADEFNDRTLIEKIVLLEDGSSSVISPVVDFPAIAQQFVEDMKSKGMKTAKTIDF